MFLKIIVSGLVVLDLMNKLLIIKSLLFSSFMWSFQVIVAIGRIRSLTEGYSVNTPLTLETENTTIDFSSTNNFWPDANSNNVMDSVSF